MMTTKKITAANVDEQIRALYETAFPVEEQIPWEDLMRLIEVMPLDFTAYYDGETFIGFTIVYPRKFFNWFWYFAVHEKVRCQGYGQQILTCLLEQNRDEAIILDMESPEQPCDNVEQRRRRHSFYLRNGFRDTNVCRTFDGITYTIMMKGEGRFSTQDYDAIIHELQQFWWRK